MGQSVYTKVGFGVVLDDDAELPWQAEEYDGDEEAWWRAQCGWTEPRPDGEFESAAVQSYYDRRNAFDAAHPLPVEVERYGYVDYTTPVLLVAGTRQSNEYAGDLDVERIAEHATREADDAVALKAFCKKYKIKLGRQQPRWLLFGVCW